VNAHHDELVFVPNVGFRLAHGALGSENVVVRRGAQTLTAGLTSDRDGAEITVTISGVEEQLDFRKSRPVDTPVRIVDDRGRALDERPSRYVMNSHFYRLMEGPTQFQRMVTLDRLDPDVRSVEFAMTSAAGDWRVAIPVQPLSASGARGVSTDAKAVVHDIEIAVPLVACTPALTAVEIDAYDLRRGEPPVSVEMAERWLEGIGAIAHSRALGQDLLILRDNTGAQHLECPRPVQDRAPRGRRREVALFGPMPEGAVSASLEIPYVAVRERSDELKVPVPAEIDVTLNGCRAHLTTSRVEHSSDSTENRPSPIEGLNGPCMRIVIVPADTDAERQLAMCGVMESNDRGMTMSVTRSGPPVIEVPDPTGDSPYVTLRNPVIRLRGPWTLELPLPARAP